MKRYDTILWDWNGTLLDDLALNLKVENRLLARRGLTQMGSKEVYLAHFGFPIIRFYERLGFDFSKERYTDVADEYMDVLRELSHEAGLFADAKPVLQTLQNAGFHQVIISAAEQTLLLQQVQEFGIDPYFEAVLGSSDNLGQSKVDTALSFLRAHALDPARTAFIGDTTHDYETAAALGCDCFFVSRGHNSRARLLDMGCPVYDSLSDLCERLVTA